MNPIQLRKVHKKEFIPKKVTFIVTKTQNLLLTDIGHGFIRPIMFSVRKDLAIHFIHGEENHGINRTTMLALMQKGLIIFDIKLMTFVPTKLGKRMIKLGKQTPNKTIVTSVLTKSKDITLALKSYTR